MTKLKELRKTETISIKLTKRTKDNLLRIAEEKETTMSNLIYTHIKQIANESQSEPIHAQ